MGLEIVQIGNFDPPHSTENDLFKTLLACGHDIWAIQEQDLAAWEHLLPRLTSSDAPDCVIWTRTKSLSDQIPADLRRKVQVQAYLSEIPTIGVHLDRWWGLSRQSDLYNDPFFRCEYLFTADGHDPERWQALGANHHWMPPAIAPHNCGKGLPQARFESEIASSAAGTATGTPNGRIAASWWSSCATTTANGSGSGRSRASRPSAAPELRDLYASVGIVIGDSALVPDPITAQPWTRYTSDRLPETVGRGGFMLHPWVAGVTDGSLYTTYRHLDCWTLGDWVELREKIDYYLGDEMSRRRIARDGMLHVGENHTYANRLNDIFTTVGLTW